MNKIIVDFEMNCAAEREIIEIGAVLISEQHEIISEYSSYVKPCQYSITKKTTKLTGITENDVIYSSTLEIVLHKFLDWCGSDDFQIYSWSMTDYEQLRNETSNKNICDARLTKVFDNWYDFQREFGDLISYPGQLSLKHALSAIDITFTGKHHSALVDAQNTASLYFLAHTEAKQSKINTIKEWFTPKQVTSTIGDLFPDLALLIS